MKFPLSCCNFPSSQHLDVAQIPGEGQEREVGGGGGGREGGQGRVLTTAVGLQRDITGQRELHEGCYYTGVEPPGLSQQALGCVWELEARVDPIWKDFQGVFTSGLMTGREAEQAAWTQSGVTQPGKVLAGWPGSARPQSGSLCLCFCLDHLPSSTGSCLSFNSA